MMTANVVAMAQIQWDTGNDDFVGIDLDDCRNPETNSIEQWAQEIIEDLPTYWEISPSGTGARAWCRGKLPQGGGKKEVLKCMMMCVI